VRTRLSGNGWKAGVSTTSKEISKPFFNDPTIELLQRYNTLDKRILDLSLLKSLQIPCPRPFRCLLMSCDLHLP
jgi:hypothetical protein